MKTWPVAVCCDQTSAQVRLLTDDLTRAAVPEFKLGS